MLSIISFSVVLIMLVSELSFFFITLLHGLIHLPFFVNLHGPLDNFSAFKYENYLKKLKTSMKCCRFPLLKFKRNLKVNS